MVRMNAMVKFPVRIAILKRLTLKDLLLRSAYINDLPIQETTAASGRKSACHNGCVIVRGKDPVASGEKAIIFALQRKNQAVKDYSNSIS